MKEKMTRVLVVEDDPEDFMIIKSMFSNLRDQAKQRLYEVDRVANYAEAFEQLKKEEYGVCLLDYRLPGGTGLDFLREVKRKGILIPIIFLTGLGNSEMDNEAMMLGAADFLNKNKVDSELLGRSIRYTLERHKTEKANARLASIVESSPEAIYLVNLKGHILSWNPGAEKMYGFKESEIAGKDISLLMPPDVSRKFVDLLLDIQQERSTPFFQTEHNRKDGSSVEVSVSMAPLNEFLDHVAHVMVIVRDITEWRKTEDLLKRQEERLRQSEKMDAIGQLSAGIAHDFNNLLNVISGNAELLEFDANPEQKGELEDIKKAVQRGSEMTRQLLIFSRKDVSQLSLVNMNHITEEVVKMLRRMITENVEIELKLEPELRFIKADSLHIQQILMNLAVNARDAMPTGGKLLIETTNMDLGEEVEKDQVTIPAGHYVVLSVSDTGMGMDKELQKKIFEPFFTTKEPGKGTGLGLSTVYGVVQKYAGYIWVYSEKRIGTTFRICFKADEAAGKVDERVEKKSLVGGTEKVLVVEDEELLRKVIVKTLEQNGYQVLEAANGEEALYKMVDAWKDVDLLVTDSVMPKMSGKQLADMMHRIRKDMKMLFISGYPRDVLSTQGVLSPEIQLLQKPFSSEALLRKVREVLDGSVDGRTANK